MTRAALRIALAGLALAGPLVTACNFLLNLDTSQCGTDSDCTRFGASYQCVASTCVSKDAGVKTDGGHDGGHDSGHDAGKDAPHDALPDGSCTSSPQCVAKNANQAYVCQGTTHQCVPINYPAGSTQICTLPNYPVLYGTPSQLTDPNDILIGAFLPIANLADFLNGPVALNYQNALQEIAQTSGLPGTNGNRKLSIVYCDNSPTVSEQGMQYLVNTLQVPAILADFNQPDLVTYFNKYALPNHVFMINPSDAPERLIDAGSHGYLWNLFGQADQLVPEFLAAMKLAEPFVRAQGDGGSANIKVALVTSGNGCPGEQAISAGVLKGLTFNGMSVSTNTTMGLFKSFSVPCGDPGATFDAGSTDAGVYASVASSIGAFAPNVVLSITGPETGEVVGLVENSINGHEPSGSLPVWILSYRAANDANVIGYLGTASNNQQPSDKIKRFMGVTYAAPADKTQLNAWKTRMANTFTALDAAVYQNFENYYDSIYWLAYGLYAGGLDASAVGSAFSLGLPKLTSGPVINPGASATITAAFMTLASNPQATYGGALGTLNYPTPATGVPLSPGDLYCYSQTGAGVAPLYDDYLYDPDAGVLVPNKGDAGCNF